MKIHQLITCGKYKLKYRDLSCFCENASGNCDCHFPIYYDFAKSVSNNIQKQQNLKRKQNIETAKNLQKKARRRESSSSSESERNIEYAESDASDVLSDVSRNTDLDYFDEIRHDNYLDEKSGSFQKRIDPNKKINILSTVIVQKPFKNSNNDVETQVPIYVTRNKDQKTPTKHLEADQQECNTTEILDFKKVTPLSQIRYSEENKAHLNLRLSKIFLEEGTKINPASNKENHDIPSTSKIDDSITIKTDFKERQETMDLDVDASVLVRYYQRKQWKYYIGFVTQVLNKDGETFYKIRFLKTIKSPNLRFFMTKKSEIDIVPINSIVKRVNLRSLGEAKEYFLKEEFDYVYFT